MSKKLDAADLMLIGMIIDQKGFEILEEQIKERYMSCNNLSGITQNVFDNGKLKGKTEGMEDVLYLIKTIKTAIRELNEKDNK